MRAFVIVRYSLVSRGIARTWSIGQNGSFEDYVKSVLDPERLAVREVLFEKLVLHSIVKQTRPVDSSWFQLLVLTSEALPPANRDRLEAMLKPYDWARIVYGPVEGGGRSTNQLLRESLGGYPDNKPFPFVTMRLDDDDALSADFLERVSPYCTAENEGAIVSFGSGFCGLWSAADGCFTSFARLHHPKIAIGMSLVGMFDPKTASITSNVKNIYEAGGHMHVDKQHPFIMENSTPSFLRSLYPTQDSATSSAKQWDARNVVDEAAVRNYIPFG